MFVYIDLREEGGVIDVHAPHTHIHPDAGQPAHVSYQNQTGNLSVHRTTLNQMSHTCQGWSN